MQSSKNLAASTAYLRNIKTTVEVFESWITEASVTLRDYAQGGDDDSELADAFHEAVTGLCEVAGEAICTAPPSEYRQLHLHYLSALTTFALTYRSLEALIDTSPRVDITKSKALKTGVVRGLTHLRIVQRSLADAGHKPEKAPDGPVLQA